jgi:hypothetical protein
MRICVTATSILLALTVVGRCLAQAIPVSAPEILAADDFFSRVQVNVGLMSRLAREEQAFLNGQAIQPDHPALANVIGLTETESKVLSDIVAEYRAGMRAHYQAISPLRREALYQVIESDKVAPVLAQRIQELLDRHAKDVLELIEKLRMTLGDSRFQALAASVKKK